MEAIRESGGSGRVRTVTYCAFDPSATSPRRSADRTSCGQLPDTFLFFKTFQFFGNMVKMFKLSSWDFLRRCFHVSILVL